MDWTRLNSRQTERVGSLLQYRLTAEDGAPAQSLNREKYKKIYITKYGMQVWGILHNIC